MEVGLFILSKFSLHLLRCFAFHVNVHVDKVNKRSGKIQSEQRQIENYAISVPVLYSTQNYFVRSLKNLVLRFIIKWQLKFYKTYGFIEFLTVVYSLFCLSTCNRQQSECFYLL